MKPSNLAPQSFWTMQIRQTGKKNGRVSTDSPFAYVALSFFFLALAYYARVSL